MITPAESREILAAAEQVCSAAAAAQAVQRVAAEITQALEAENPLVLCVMTGAIVFAGQLLPLLAFPLDVDYLHLTRYGNATRGGNIDWIAFPRGTLGGRTVLVVDDILDEGHTLRAIRDRVLASGATRCYCTVFADKDIGRPKPLVADFVGVRVPNRYVFGFGMDVKGAWRNLPAVYALKE
jgi:hypoxanthine phosphoribosyltransferase